MRVWITSAILLCSIVAVYTGISDRAPIAQGGKIIREGNDPVIATDPNDAELNVAMAKGKQTFRDFVAMLDQPNGREFFVKMGMVARGGYVEYIWLASVKRSNGKIVGVLDNEPIHDIGVKEGDFVIVRPRDVRDWIVYDGNTDETHGGFTIPILEKRMRKN